MSRQDIIDEMVSWGANRGDAARTCDKAEHTPNTRFTEETSETTIYYLNGIYYLNQ